MDEVKYEPCLKHPHVLLPVPARDGEKHLCYECAQEQRRVTYAKQKAEATATTLRRWVSAQTMIPRRTELAIEHLLENAGTLSSSTDRR